VRIGHVGVEIVPSGNGTLVGGLVKNVATLAQLQAARGHDVTIFTTDVEGQLPDDAAMPYGRVRRIPARGEYGSLPFAATFVFGSSRELLRAHRQRPFDVLHVHSAYSSLGSIAYLVRPLRAPKVFSLYSPNFRSVPGHDCNGGRRLSRDLLARTLLAAFDATIVPSRNLRSRLLQLGLPEEQVVQIPPALSPAMYRSLPSRESARSALGIPDGTPVVLFLGNYSPWKGADVLVRAMREVRRQFPETLLVAAWGEPYRWAGNRRREVLSLIEALGLRDAVRHHGIMEDVRTMLRAADLVVAPFLCTCKVLDQPLSILEAMACERPVVSTEVGGIPELLGRGERGIVVPPKNVEAVAGSIRHLLAHPDEARELGRRGAEWARDQSQPDVVGRTLESLYARLVNRASDGSLRPLPTLT